MLPAHGQDSEFSGAPFQPIAAGWSHAIRPCVLAAAIAMLLMFLELNPFVTALVAGFLAVFFTQRGSPGVAIRPAAGTRLGAFSGLLLFGMSTIFETLAVVVLHKGSEIRSGMIDKIQQAAARYPGSQVQPLLEFVRTPDGFAVFMVASMIFGLAAFLVLSGIGGAVTASVIAKQRRP